MSETPNSTKEVRDAVLGFDPTVDNMPIEIRELLKGQKGVWSPE